MKTRIRSLRLNMGKTQKQIAEYLTCDCSLYSRYECGTRKIPITIIIKLADYYNKSIDYILCRTDNKN